MAWKFSFDVGNKKTSFYVHLSTSCCWKLKLLLFHLSCDNLSRVPHIQKKVQDNPFCCTTLPLPGNSNNIRMDNKKCILLATCVQSDSTWTHLKNNKVVCFIVLEHGPSSFGSIDDLNCNLACPESPQWNYCPWQLFKFFCVRMNIYAPRRRDESWRKWKGTELNMMGRPGWLVGCLRLHSTCFQDVSGSGRGRRTQVGILV